MPPIDLIESIAGIDGSFKASYSSCATRGLSTRFYSMWGYDVQQGATKTGAVSSDETNQVLCWILHL